MKKKGRPWKCHALCMGAEAPLHLPVSLAALDLTLRLHHHQHQLPSPKPFSQRLQQRPPPGSAFIWLHFPESQNDELATDPFLARHQSTHTCPGPAGIPDPGRSTEQARLQGLVTLSHCRRGLTCRNKELDPQQVDLNPLCISFLLLL